METTIYVVTTKTDMGIDTAVFSNKDAAVACAFDAEQQEETIWSDVSSDVIRDEWVPASDDA